MLAEFSFSLAICWGVIWAELRQDVSLAWEVRAALERAPAEMRRSADSIPIEAMVRRLVEKRSGGGRVALSITSSQGKSESRRLTLDIVIPICHMNDVEVLDLEPFTPSARIFFYDLCGEFALFLPRTANARGRPVSPLPTTEIAGGDVPGGWAALYGQSRRRRLYSLKNLLQRFDSPSQQGRAGQAPAVPVQPAGSDRAGQPPRLRRNQLFEALLRACKRFDPAKVFFDDSHEEEVRTLDVGVRFLSSRVSI